VLAVLAAALLTFLGWGLFGLLIGLAEGVTGKSQAWKGMLGGLIGAATLLVVNWLLVRWTYHHPSVERLVEGTPTVLIEDGALDQRHLARELVTVDELRSAAHHQGLLSLEDVERAVLESDGTLTFVPRPDATRVRRHAEILGRLDALQADIAALRSSPPAAAGIPAAGRESPPEP